MSKNQQIVLQKRPSGMVEDEDFSLIESTLRPLEEGEILVRNEFISLDPAMRGWMNPGTTYIKGVELGEVMRAFAVGRVMDSKYEGIQVGDIVSGMIGVQSHSIVAASQVEKKQDTGVPLSYHLGTLGMPGMTAYFGLLEQANPQEGEVVFVSAGAGMIGSLVGQIAKEKKCKVVGTASSDAKLEYMKSIGFDTVINYKTEDVHARLKEAYPNGVHVYYDNVGGEMLDIALANLANGARVIICGAISQYNKKEMYGPKNYMKIVTARGSMKGIIVFDFMDRYPEAVAQLSSWIEDGKIKVHEHIVEGIENFPKALRMLFTGENFGKLVLKI